MKSPDIPGRLSEQAGRVPIGVGGAAETVVDVVAVEHPQRVSVQAEPGVVIDHVEDLDPGAVGKRPVGDVSLPPLVGLLGDKPQVAALRALVRLRGDETPIGQDPPDRRDRRRAA